MTLAGIGKPDDVLTVMETFKMSIIMLMIVGFYFAGGAIDSFNRKGNTTNQDKK